MTAKFTQKYIKLKMIPVLLLLSLFLMPGAVLAGISSDQVISRQTIAEGAVYEQHKVTTASGRVLVYVIKADLTNPYLKINPIVGTDGTFAKNARVTDMAASAGAVAAFNADFFQMGESGRPVGMTVQDGRVISSPSLTDYMFSWAITRDKTPVIDIFNFSGLVTAQNGAQFTLAGINKPEYKINGSSSHDNAILLYDRFWGGTSRGKLGDSDNVVEVFVKNGVVAKVRVNQPGMAIPADGYVLAGRGAGADFINANIKAGDSIEVNYNITPHGDEISAGTGGWSLLVGNGKVMDNFPSDINGQNARTAIGFSGDAKTLYLVAVEKSSNSRGLTLEDLAAFMIRLGANRALNLDGGGSTTFAMRPLGDEKPELMLTPQGGKQRLLPTAIGLFNTAPKGELAGLLIKGRDVIIAGEKVSFTAKGYDTHYNPFRLEPGKLSWSVDEGPGSFENNVFSSKYGGKVDIMVKYDNVISNKSIQVLGLGDFKKVSVEPSSISVKPGTTVDFKVKATANDNREYELTAENYNAVVDQSLGSLKDGKFTAASSDAEGKITVTFAGFSIDVPVQVTSREQVRVNVTPGQPASLEMGKMSLQFSAGSLSEPAAITAETGGKLPESMLKRYTEVSVVNLSLEGGASTLLAEPALLTWGHETWIGRAAVLQYTEGAWRELPSRIDDGNGIILCRIWEIAPVALVIDQQAAPEFADIPDGYWAAGAVSKLSAAGIVSGYPGNVFAPTRQISRAEFAVILCKAMGWRPLQEESGFKDKSGIPAWAAGYITAAVEKGVIAGYEDDTFRPDNQVKRSEVAVMISKALSLPAKEDAQADKIFADGESIPSWAAGQVAAVYEAGIMKGDNEKKFRPGDRTTRAEGAVLINNALNYVLTK